MKVIVTICSKHKNDEPELLPARERYTGDHIAKTEQIANESDLPFFILSGKYGLLAADEKVSNYDYYLEPEAINDLAKVVEGQLLKFGITEIEFYTKGKESWESYEIALRKATELAGATLVSRQL